MKEMFLTNMSKKINIIYNEILKPSGIILHLHGAGSHFQYIMDTPNDIKNRMNFFGKHNIMTYALEFQNHGKSDGELGIVNDYNDLISDLKLTIDYIELQHKDVPLFIMAESMGGGVAIKNAIINKPNIKGYILLAPLCGIADIIKPNIVMQKILIYGSYYFPNYNLTRNGSLDKSCIYDKYIQAKIKCEYNLEDFKLSTARECYYLSNWIEDNGHKFTDNIIVLHSQTDKVTCPQKSKEFINKCSSLDKEIHLINDGNHTLLVPMYDNDYYPFVLLHKILNWVNNKM